MSEAIDATADSEDAAHGEVEEDELEAGEGTFPQLIASTPSVTSLSSTRNKYRQLADALCLEAQEVERSSGQMPGGGWGTEPSLVPYTGPDLTVLISSSQSSSPQAPPPQASYIIVRGDGKAVDSQENGAFTASALDSPETETDIDGMFLTLEEQVKK
jgi:hypothetical protein